MRCGLSLGVDSAVNLTASTTSPMNLAMPRLLSLQEAANCRPAPMPPLTKSQVPDATTTGGQRSTWAVANSVRPQRPAGLVSKSQTVTSPWSFPTNPGSSQTLRPRSSTSLTGARQLQTSTTTAADSIPPLRIARPQHLQAQMKQALNPSKLSIVRSTATSPLSSATSRTSSSAGHTSRDGPLAGAAVTRDSGRSLSSGAAPQSSKLLAGKSGTGVTSDQSALVALKLAVAERRHSSDTIPVNTLKVDSVLFHCKLYVILCLVHHIDLYNVCVCVMIDWMFVCQYGSVFTRAVELTR